jgi:hypothetical protein
MLLDRRVDPCEAVDTPLHRRQRARYPGVASGDAGDIATKRSDGQRDQHGEESDLRPARPGHRLFRPVGQVDAGIDVRARSDKSGNQSNDHQ